MEPMIREVATALSDIYPEIDVDRAVQQLIGGGRQVMRRGGLSTSVTAVPDSDEESLASHGGKGNFATTKTHQFAMANGILEGDLTGTGHNGKITMTDVKNAMPKKKRGRPGKGKKVKDPLAPKKPTTAYFIYLADKRQEFKEENPEFKAIEVTKGIAVIWNALSADEKQPYIEQYEAAKVQYAKDFAAYKASKETAMVPKEAESPKAETPKAESPKTKSPKKKAKKVKTADAKSPKTKSPKKKAKKVKKKAKKVKKKVETADAETPKAESPKTKSPKKKAKKVKKKAKKVKKPKVEVVEEEDDELLLSDMSDASDSELEEDAVQFEYEGTFYWRNDDNTVMTNSWGPQIGVWDDGEAEIIFDE